ncbi:MAG: class I SAM-dependent methyltransferase [Thermoplasmata archaeon]|nr:class I SAM-dependent methyltransferase [Thermoplasmata archaeon]
MSPKRSHPRDPLVIGQVAARLALEWTFRPLLRPSLDEFRGAARTQDTVAHGLLDDPRGESTRNIPRYRAEFDELVASMAGPLAAHYPPHWRIEPEPGFLLYGLVRSRSPSLVVETGVADGFSSRLILEALRRNGSGRLVSVDRRDDVGALVPPNLRPSWELTILGRGRRYSGLRALFSSTGPVDMFLHDSAHTYRHQLREYRAAWPNLRPAGLLLSDDADASFAFLDFARSVGGRPDVLVSRTRVFGVLPRAGAAAT